MEFLLVFFQIALEHEWFSTVVTCESAVVCVHAEMLKDVLLLSERFLAGLVLALEGGRVSVCLGVEDLFEIVPVSWNTFEPFDLFFLRRILGHPRRWVSAVGSLGLIGARARSFQLWVSLVTCVFLTFEAWMGCELLVLNRFVGQLLNVRILALLKK